MPIPFQRDDLVADAALRGAAWCEAHTARIDGWLRSVWDDARTDVPVRGRVALVATGGHGRRELCLRSDLDLLLLVEHRGAGDELAARLWYPIWDQGLKLGHSVRTPRDALSLAKDDLDTATALLSARVVAGDEELGRELAEAALTQWRKEKSNAIPELHDRVRERHEAAGEVAFLLEPNLKEARGGLRDVHSLAWLDLATPVLSAIDEGSVRGAYDVLLAARVELHRWSSRRSDVLLLQDQDAVAAALDLPDADVLMKEIATAARAIAWTSDSVWHRVLGTRRRSGVAPAEPRVVGDGVVLADGNVCLTASARVAEDPASLLRVALAAVTHRAAIALETLERLASDAPAMPDPWPDGARWLFTDLLLAGHHAIPVIESLDQLRLFERVIPEWAAVRSKPQRNAYHRFTVDRHLCEAAAEAARLAPRVVRPDLLVVGALLHDLGKGFDGDHIEAGVELTERIASRMGFARDEVDVLVALVRHHLLLPDVATRRDLDDDGTIRSVAAQVGGVDTLEMLAALTEADSIATGPSAWSGWKAQLVEQLVRRTAHVLRGGDARDVVDTGFPSEWHRRLLSEHRLAVVGDGDMLTVAAPDRPGLFARVAGVLALNGLGVRSATVHTEDGMALEVYRVAVRPGVEANWARVARDVDAALTGRLALRARLAERARSYPAPRPTAARPVEPKVLIDNDTSAAATVVEVQAPDRMGLLYRITQALLDCDLDIVSAKVETLGTDAFDAFYVRDTNGAKVHDAAHLAEVERAVLHAIAAEL